MFMIVKQINFFPPHKYIMESAWLQIFALFEIPIFTIKSQYEANVIFLPPIKKDINWTVFFLSEINMRNYNLSWHFTLRFFTKLKLHQT